MKREDGYIRYAGDEAPNLVFHDGGLRPAVGTWNVQVMRANRAHPECAEGVGNLQPCAEYHLVAGEILPGLPVQPRA